jgi:competence protein ComEA
MDHASESDDNFAPQDADSASSDWEANVVSALHARSRGLAIAAIATFASVALALAWPSSMRSDSQGLNVPFQLDLNAASEAELHLLPGVGEKLVRAILDRRQELGGFRDIQELKTVPGIKQGKFAAIAPYVFVHTESHPSQARR